MREIIGRKVGMTRLFDEDGTAIPVTVVVAGPCTVVQERTAEKEGYRALAVGFGSAKKKNKSKPVIGQYAKAKIDPTRVLVEVAVPPGFEGGVGDSLKADLFKEGEFVDVIGTSAGKGWQGVMRRHNFGGVGGATHGQSDRLRAPGSIGASSFPSRVFKGQRMAGRMGGGSVTVKNIRIAKVDAEKGLILLSGAVPGKPDAILRIRGR